MSLHRYLDLQKEDAHPDMQQYLNKNVSSLLRVGTPYSIGGQWPSVTLDKPWQEHYLHMLTATFTRVSTVCLFVCLFKTRVSRFYLQVTQLHADTRHRVSPTEMTWRSYAYADGDMIFFTDSELAVEWYGLFLHLQAID
jgi:hypothetical protein